MLQRYTLLHFRATNKTCLKTSVSEHNIFFPYFYDKKSLFMAISYKETPLLTQQVADNESITEFGYKIAI